ncbi:hypothetical protein TL16_g01946 [Triparma laevis f. inornata]|uniref:Uncharacterized protein n=1 Tax=Triparma laevis f. inornata TaxID=1714386 RepID=A0A9W6ZS75_9STRA|nr:hypothetical protein TL16_g01946 [Triparma laevis f. inornata]
MSPIPPPSLLLLLSLLLSPTLSIPCQSATSPCPLSIQSPTFGPTPSSPLPYDGRTFYTANIDIESLREGYGSYDLINDPDQLYTYTFTMTETFGRGTILMKVGTSGSWPTSYQTSHFHSNMDSMNTRNSLTLPLSKLLSLEHPSRADGDYTTGLHLRFVIENISDYGTGGTLSFNLLLTRLSTLHYPSSSSTPTNPVSSLPNTSIDLSEGVPILGSNILSGGGSSKSYSVYSFTVPSGADYTVSMTAITGTSYGLKFLIKEVNRGMPILEDAEHCNDSITCSVNKPSASYLRIEHNFNNPSVRNYYVMVYGTTSTETPILYSILAAPSTTEEPTHLINGVTLFDVGMRVDRLNFFELHVPADSTSFSVTVTPIATGTDPSVYISTSTFGDSSTATWQSHRQGNYAEAITVTNSDPDFKLGGGTYFITVATPHQNNEVYTILPVTSENTPIYLQPGQPQHDTLPVREWRYYQYFFDGDVVIDVTPDHGDPDVYVGCRFEPEVCPGASCFNATSTQLFEDALTIKSSSSTLPEGSRIFTQDCPIIYIGVYSYPLPQSTSSSYIITAVPVQGTTSVVPGISYEGTVYRDTTKYYSIHIGAESVEISILVTPFYGDPDVYIKVCVEDGEVASKSNHDFSSILDQYHDDRVTIGEGQIQPDCEISIAVLGFSQSQFTLTATIEDVDQSLTAGKPFKETVAAYSTQTFEFTSNEEGDLRLYLTMLSGVAWLQASQNKTFITSDACTADRSQTNPPTCWRDHSASTNSISMLTIPNQQIGDVTYIGVTGISYDTPPTSAMFTIMAKEENTDTLIQLIDGVGQNYIAQSQTDMTYYQIRLSGGHDELRLSLAPKSSKFVMYVKQCVGAACEQDLPSPTNNGWASVCQSEESLLQVSRNDTQGTSYLIGVTPCGSSPGGGYTLTGEIDKKVLLLSMGRAVSDYSRINNYAQFKVYMPEINPDNPNQQAAAELFVSITCLSGDADLFVSRNPNPTREDHMWGQTRWGSDALTIYPEDSNYCSGCYYFISVYGYEEALYTILATVKSDEAVVIYPGMPQSDQVSESGVNNYAFEFIRTDSSTDSASEQIEISLTPAFGDPDIFILVSDGTGESGNNGRGHPGPTNWDYYSLETNQREDHVVIRTNTPRFNNRCPLTSSMCLIQIAITGFHEADYMLTVTTNLAITTLAIDQPFQGVIARRSYEYFKVTVNDQQQGLKLSLTPTAGSSELFVSCTNELPSIHDYSFTSFHQHSTTATSLSTTISGNSLAARGCDSFPAEVYVSVFNNDTVTTSSFILTPTLINNDDGGDSLDQLTFLPHGLMLSGDVEYQKFTYYKVSIGGGDTGEDLSLSVITASGDVDIYVSNDWETKPFYDTATNEVKNYVYSSAHSGSNWDELITIPNLVPTQHTSYVVGVFGRYAKPSNSDCDDDEWGGSTTCDTLVDLGVTCDGFFCPSCPRAGQCDRTCNFCPPTDTPTGLSSYTVLAETTKTITKLMDGVPVTSYVETAAYKYYSTTITDPSSDVSISVTPLSGGDPDVYVSVNGLYSRFPNRTNHDFVSMGYGADTMMLQHNQLVAACGGGKISTDNPCTLYIGIFGYNHTRFSIMSNLDYGWSSPILLVDGQPQSSLVKHKEYQYYYKEVGIEEGKIISFTLTPLDDGDADLYLTTSRNSEPGVSNFDLRSTGWSGADTIVIRPGDEHYCTSCTFYLAVYGFKETSYSLVGSTGLTSITCGTVANGQAWRDYMTYFSYYHSTTGGDVEISVMALTGDPDIYVTAGGGAAVLPTQDDYIWKSGDAGSDYVLIAEEGDPNYCTDCDYTIGIYAWGSNSTFAVMVNSGECIRNLYPGRPQSANLGAGEATFYKMTLGSSSAAMDVAMTMQWGEADIYIKTLSDGVVWDASKAPDPNDRSSYDYTSANNTVDRIRVDGPHETATTFIIGVFASNSGGCRYNIVGSFSQTQIVLLAGVPQRHFVEEGVNEYFYFNVDRADVDLQVTVTSITGDPDMMISYDNQHPNCQIQGGTGHRLCGNYTWFSNNPKSDTIVINHNNPCTPTADTVDVSSTCDNKVVKDMFRGGGSFYVGVFGFFGSSSFMITASYKGSRTKLVTGTPQTGHTSAQDVCRNRDENGACTGSEEHRVQTAIFEFEVGSDNWNFESHVSFSINLDCTESNQDPGCPEGGKLTAYVNVCVDDDSDPNRCVISDMYPTSGNADLEEVLTPDERTIVFVPNDPSHPSSISCNPVNSRASCKYFLAVEGIDDIYNEATFQVTAIRPGNLAVIPCGSSSAPDGITTWGTDRVHQEMQGYEICGSDLVAPHGFLDVTLEICSGNLELRICDGDNSCNGVVPAHNDYSVFSTPEKTCTFKPKVEATPTCRMDEPGSPVSVQVSYAQVDTYFTSVTGSGTYNLVIGSFKSDDFTPHIKSSGSVTTENGGSLTLNWNPGRVVLSGIPNGVEPVLMDYEVYYVRHSLLVDSINKFDGSESEINLLSRCGLIHMIDIVQPNVNIDVNSADYGMVYVENHDDNPHSYTFTGLTEDEDFVFYVVGKCDTKCMTQIVATNPETNVQCSVFSPCQTVYGLFPAVTAKTSGGGMFGGKVGVGTVIGAVGGVIGLGLIVGLVLFCMKRGTVEGGGHVIGGDDEEDENEIDSKETGMLTDPAGDVRDGGYKPPVNPFASNQIVEKEPEEFHI